MTVLVTGAGGAIGSAIVHALREVGRPALEHDLGFREAARDDVPRVESDLTTREGLDAIARAAREYEVTGVVASHGIQGAGPLRDVTPEAARRTFAVNAASVPALWEACLPALERTGGVFVAVASQASLRAEPENAAYCAAKWAVLEWVRHMAPFAPEGVALRALCPGRTESSLLYNSMDEVATGLGITRAEYEAQVLTEIPVGRFATPEDIAAGAVYLLSRGSSRPVVLAPTGGEVPW